MQTVTTKAVAKVAAVATGLAMATSMLSLAPMAHAASLSASQVSSILSLLSSFGADASTIANVQASLTGSAPSTTTSGSTTTTTGSGYAFSRDLTVGSTGADVTALQNALISKGYMAGSATGYFGAITKAAVIKWQMAAGVTPAAGYFGAKSRAAFGGTTTTTTTTTTTGGVTAGTGTGLKVSLSPMSPSGSVLVQGQAIGDLADFVFANPTSAPIAVTALSFKRIGVSNDSTMTNVYLYNAGTRITDSAGISTSAFSYTNASGLFTVPAGGVYTVSVRSDIAGSTNGQQLGVSLVSVTGGTLDSSVSLPINSGYQTISAATLATVDFTVAPTPSAVTTISPQNDYPLWQDTVSVSTNPVKLSSIKFSNLGSIDSTYVINLRLYVDGTMVGSAIPTLAADRSVTFDLSANPFLLSTQSHVVKVMGNLTGGANRTVQLSVQRTSDAMLVDSQLGQPVTPTYLGSTFTAVSTAAVTIQAVSSTSGVSVSLDGASPTANVSVGGSNIKWATFDMLASGENVKVTDLYVYASTTKSTGALDGVGGLKNGKIFVNGVQVGSTKDLGSLSAAATDFSLGSSLILPAGQTTKIDIYADAKTTASVNLLANDTVIVSLKAGSSNAQGQSSLISTSVPASAVSGNSITVTASTLTATKYTGYGSQTVIAGSNSTKIGAFTLAAGSTEGVMVNTIGINLSTAAAASITNLTLKDDATGNVLGTVVATPSTANSFSVNYDVPASSTKTIDVYANVLSGANNGTITVGLDYTTGGTGDVTGTSALIASSNTAASGGTPAYATLLQTITVGAGTLSVTNGAGDPTSSNILAGASSVMVGEFNFAASNSAYTVNNVSILVPNNSATAVTNVTVKYKDANGAAQSATQSLTVNASNQYATATFTGLGMYVPMNDSANLDIYVGTPTIASAGSNISGNSIRVTLDTGATSGTFLANNSAGTSATSVNSGVNVAAAGTFYVRKSIPTFAMLPAPSTIPTSGTALYRFSVTADPAGAIEWTHLLFTVATTSATISNLYLTDESNGASLLDPSGAAQYATTTRTSIAIDLIANTTSAKYAQVAAGATKIYDLYATTVTGFTTGSTVTLNLTSDAGTVSNLAASAQGVVSGVGTVWSDRSATSHTVLTSDWTNGYLLKNFTTNATVYSK